MSAAEAKAAIEKYASAVERRLKPGLDAACELRDKAFEQLAETEQMEKALDVLDVAAEAAAEKGAEAQRDVTGRLPPALETKVNIGEEFYMNAHVHSLEPVIVDVGLGALVEMSRQEAREFVTKRRGMLEAQAATQTKRIAEVQAHLEHVVRHLAELKVAAGTTALREKLAGIAEED